MKTAAISTCSGHQPYLYNCTIWYDGMSVVLREDISFYELVDFLSSLLLSPYMTDSLCPTAFASHLLNIATEEEYTFEIPYSLIKEYEWFN